MKRILTTTGIMILTLFFYNQSTAQINCCPQIDSLVVLPAHPTTQDTINIVVHVTTTYLGKRLDIRKDIINDQINIQACYFSGMLPALQHYSDTVTIGLLSAGDYKIHLMAYQSTDTADCTYTDSNNVTQALHVDAVTEINKPGIRQHAFVVYPNPLRGNALHVYSAEKWEELTVKDINGRSILSIKNRHTDIINFPDLSPGLYLFYFRTDAGNQVIKLAKE